MATDEARDPRATLAALVDVLLPGDGTFPSGSAVGLQDRLAERLPELAGPAALGQLEGALAGGGRFAALAPAARPAAVARLEREHPALFELVVKVAYLSYYESPATQAAIRSLGFAYNATPLPAGYPVGTFDAERDQPRHGRGRFLATAEVRRVDLAGLDFLAGPR
jgi:hypothetical protein